MVQTPATQTYAQANLYRASNQWRTRPDDERYLTLESLYDATYARYQRAQQPVKPVENLVLDYADDGQEGLLYLKDPQGSGQRSMFTHYAFGQFCTTVGAPAKFIRDLPAPLGTLNMEFLIAQAMKQSKLLYLPGEEEFDFDREGLDAHEFGSERAYGQLRAVTAATYGRIWDYEVASAVRDLNVRDEGRWVIPSASYSGADPKRATTLYAGDANCFMFLVDPSRPVEVAGETLFRGFMAWNSEVGDRTFGLMTFLYRYVCDNRIIWGATEVNKLIIRHTLNGPQRFAEQAVPALAAYAEGSTAKLEEQIKAAKTKRIGRDVESVAKWLREKGFGREQAKISVELAEREEGDPTTLWNTVQGLTAYARGITHTDTRVDFERRAGDLLAEVAR